MIITLMMAELNIATSPASIFSSISSVVRWLEVILIFLVKAALVSQALKGRICHQRDLLEIALINHLP